MKLVNSPQDDHNSAIRSHKLNQRELVRLMMQQMQDMGYASAARALESESGVLLRSEQLEKLGECVLGGDWTGGLHALRSLKMKSEDNLSKAEFLLLRHKYVELLLVDDMDSAVICLQSELSTLDGISDVELRDLATMLSLSDLKDVRTEANGWFKLSPAPTNSESWQSSARQALLTICEEMVSPEARVPPRRLESLITQGLEQQVERCDHHAGGGTDVGVTLYEDHSCPRETLPCHTKLVLQGHTDEVWFVAFSHSGRYLASASRDKTVMVWDMEAEGCPPIATLIGHTLAPHHVSWSPEDTQILVCGGESVIRLWKVQTSSSQYHQRYMQHEAGVVATAWLPDGGRFVSGGLDHSIHLWHLSGVVLRTWSEARVNDLRVTSEGRYVVAVCREREVLVHDLEDGSNDFRIVESAMITCVSLSADDRYMLLSRSGKSISCWDLVERRRVGNFSGHRQLNFMVRSAFGGSGDRFVVSGGEDSIVYIWKRSNGKLLARLTGHSAPVCAVAWWTAGAKRRGGGEEEERKGGLLASASDDHTIRLWGPGRDMAVLP